MYKFVLYFRPVHRLSYEPAPDSESMIERSHCLPCSVPKLAESLKTKHLGSVLFPPDYDFLELFKHFQELVVKAVLKSCIFELKSLFIACEFNVPDISSFYAFLGQIGWI